MQQNDLPGGSRPCSCCGIWTDDYVEIFGEDLVCQPCHVRIDRMAQEYWPWLRKRLKPRFRHRGAEDRQN